MEQLNTIIKTDNTEDKISNINSTQEKMILECIKKVSNPFINLYVEDVARDLKIGNNIAYDIFRRDDFPSINIGRRWKITLISYLLWKTQKRI